MDLVMLSGSQISGIFNPIDREAVLPLKFLPLPLIRALIFSFQYKPSFLAKNELETDLLVYT